MAVDDDAVYTVFTIKPDTMFVEEGFFQVAGLIENMAQSIGAILNREGVPRKGYLSAVKNLVVERLPKEGMQIMSYINELYGNESNKIVHVTVKENNETIAMANIYITKPR